MKVLVTGGRNFADQAILFAELDKLEPRPTLIIEGGQRTFDEKTRKPIGGADYWANRWAVMRGVECVTVRANWSDLETQPVKIKAREDGTRYNVLAGFARNARMIAMAPNHVIACRGGKGTKDCKQRAAAAGIPITLVMSPPRAPKQAPASPEPHKQSGLLL